MACTRPINCYQSPSSGKVYFTPSPGLDFIQLPCGQCIGCRWMRAREWSVRCVAEAHSHERSSFITLTYADPHLPRTPSGLATLKRDHVTLFMKRLRRALPGKVRFFGCGEYGSKFARPHYHYIIFGEDFHADRYLWKDGKYPLFRSPLLEECWHYGMSSVAEFSIESANYVAKYCVKKVNGQAADAHYQDRVPEFPLFSNRPGIGADYFFEYYDDLAYSDRFITRGGKSYPLPRYFQKLLQGCDLEQFESNREKRIANARSVDPWRLADIDKFNQVTFNRSIRSFEDES